MNHSSPNPPNNDWLENLLLEEPGYIDDAGFTAKTLAVLPKDGSPGKLRNLILGISAFCAFLTALFALPSTPEIVRWLKIASATAVNSQSLVLFAMVLLAGLFASSCFIWVSREN